MLKNFKVTTKLVAILVAPVLVLIALAYVGVNQRLGDASDATRVQDLTEFTGTNADLIKELEVESILSAQVGASPEQRGQEQLAEQRGKTDAALNAYREKIKEVDPGRDSDAVADDLRSAEGRLTQLEVVRRSIDQQQSEITDILSSFNTTLDQLVRLSQSVGESVEDPELSRGFTSVVKVQALSVEAADLASQITVAAETGFFAVSLPTQSSPVASRTAIGSGCGDDAAAAGNGCPHYEAVVEGKANWEAALASLDDQDTGTATPDQKARLRAEGQEPKFQGLVRAAVEAGNGRNDLREVATDEFVTAAVNQINRYHTVGQLFLLSPDVPDSVYSLAAAQASEAQRAATVYVLLTLAAIVIGAVVTFSVARAITAPLRKLTSAAYSLSTERLPALVERLRNPEEESHESLAANLTPIDIDSKDEIGQLADSFNSIQQVTVEVAEEQSVLLRKGIGDIFINLARRNQTLLDRQIEFIDQLEANEEDPDQLDNLFKLDHLATRMRRNAESLLVLAGAEPPRRRGRPVALADVVRVAIGEVEDFARIQLLALDDATVGGNVAVDLAHLLSELMENATHFSPPDTMVEIVGHRADAGYIISVSDQGIGMSAEQLSEANHQLARPPLVGLALSRSLGFIVIGRLAQRFEISVKLTASPSGGVTALVTLPADLVTYEGEEPPTVSRDLPPAASRPAPAPEAPAEDVVVVEADLVDEADPGPAPAPAPVGRDGALLDELADEGMADSAEFERGLQEILDDDAPEPAAPATVEPPKAPRERAEPVLTVAEQIAAASRAEAKGAELTAAGLVKRTPKKRSDTAVGGGMPTTQAPRATGQSQRSPEEVRKMLSRYRSGLNKGRNSADPEKTDS